MLGKQKCKILKEIRQRIADENDIPFVTSECRHQGHCSGTCPKCESELRYLEDQLQRRTSLGKRVTVTALCAGMILTAAGCDVVENIKSRFEPTPTPEIFETEGEVPMPRPGNEEPTIAPESENEKNLSHAAAPTKTPKDEVIELEGDVPWVPDLTGYVPD